MRAAREFRNAFRAAADALTRASNPVRCTVVDLRLEGSERAARRDEVREARRTLSFGSKVGVTDFFVSPKNMFR